ncbi:MAG TPA: alkaline phosphatase family protein [Terriglobales bacterium]
MRLGISLFILAALLSATFLLLNLNGCSAASCTPGTSGCPAASTPPPPATIKHVVILFQENRSTDNLFHDPVLISRGADLANSGLNSKGQTIQMEPIPLGINYDLDHTHPAFEVEYDNGKMDGADLVTPICTGGVLNCIPPNPQYKYVQASDVAAYFQFAEQYAFGDRMFQTNQGPSFPAHQFIFAGTSSPTASSPLFVADDPNTADGFNVAGCVAPAEETVDLIGPDGKYVAPPIYPCLEHKTLSDELDAKGVSWAYYTSSSSDIWNAPSAIHHICQPQQQNGELACSGQSWNNVRLPAKTILTDITSNNLPAVSWVIPTGQASDHPAYPSTIQGPSWVASIVDAIGQSPYWADTAIIVTWDDWGGWYDHVPPPQVRVNCTLWGCGYIYGFRVPLIVISPYAKPGYISHVNHDFGSILKFVEGVFKLPSLGYADALADDLSDCFDFKQTPLTFNPVSSQFDANYFLHDTSPPLVPDTD